MNALARPLELPCGATLSNRIAKAAMTEGLADADDLATDRHIELYGRWADGGAGLQLTGNVLVDARYLERPGNVVIDGPRGEAQARALGGGGPARGRGAVDADQSPGTAVHPHVERVSGRALRRAAAGHARAHGPRRARWSRRRFSISSPASPAWRRRRSSAALLASRSTPLTATYSASSCPRGPIDGRTSGAGRSRNRARLLLEVYRAVAGQGRAVVPGIRQTQLGGLSTGGIRSSRSGAGRAVVGGVGRRSTRDIRGDLRTARAARRSRRPRTKSAKYPTAGGLLSRICARPAVGGGANAVDGHRRVRTPALMEQAVRRRRSTSSAWLGPCAGSRPAPQLLEGRTMPYPRRNGVCG